MVRDACGSSGPNSDYVIHTAAKLAALAVSDRVLERLADTLRDSL